ncbi:MAG: stalk domain-containing protein, partial [Bacillota bacterium]|nr:stalk domain-containing protein [Bacillota bacterium]
PSGVAIAPGGTIYIADTGNHVIRQIRDNQVSTIAGAGEGKADGYRQTASFSYPTGLALHPNGTLYVADKGNNAVRTIDPRGHVKTLPQYFNQPSDVFISRGGEIFVLESGRHRILKLEGNKLIEINEEALEPGYRNGKAEHAFFAFPAALSRVDQALYVADTYNHVIRRIENGRAETIVGSLTGSAFGGPEIAQLDTPSGLLATSDSLFISDTNNHRVIQIPKRENLKPVVALKKSQSVGIYIDGVKVEFADAKPFIRNGRTYVPTRSVLQFGGTSVNWDGKTRSVTITQGDRNLVLSEADGGIILKGNRSYIKLITIKEAFGYSVEWDGKHNAVLVRTK